jgi:hypothetical protein
MAIHAKESAKIIEVAKRFVGLYETEQNRAWNNPATPEQDPEALLLEEMMKMVGWRPGWAYCQSFVAAIWKQAYKELSADEDIIRLIKETFTPSVLSSYNSWNNIAQVRPDIIVSKVPVPGSAFFMQYATSWKGHAGIVINSNDSHIFTIEGNTSPAPTSATSDREGDGIFKRIRKISFVPHSGLYLKGFLHPLVLPGIIQGTPEYPEEPTIDPAVSLPVHTEKNPYEGLFRRILSFIERLLS